MSNNVPWDDLKNGKPVPPINVQGSDGSGIKTEQRSGMTYHQFSAEKETENRKIIDKTMVVINITTEN